MAETRIRLLDYLPDEAIANTCKFLELKEVLSALTVSKTVCSIFSIDPRLAAMKKYQKPKPTHVRDFWEKSFWGGIPEDLFQCTPPLIKEDKADPITVYQEFGKPSDLTVVGHLSGKLEIFTSIEVSGAVGRKPLAGPVCKIRQNKTIQHDEHKKEITQILLMKDKQRWVSVSKDNVVCTWKGCAKLRTLEEIDLLSLLSLDSMELNSILLLSNGEIAHIVEGGFITLNPFDEKPTATHFDLEFKPGSIHYDSSRGYVVERANDPEDFLDHAANVQYKGIVAVKKEGDNVKITEIVGKGKLGQIVNDKHMVVVRLQYRQKPLTHFERNYLFAHSRIEGSAAQRALFVLDTESKQEIPVGNEDLYRYKHHGSLFPLPHGRFAVITGDRYVLLNVRIYDCHATLLTNINLVTTEQSAERKESLYRTPVKAVYQMPNEKIAIVLKDGTVRTIEFESALNSEQTARNNRVRCL